MSKGLNKETERKIFEVSVAVFQAKGYAATKLQDIAKEAGINQSLLHYYFRNKESLFKTVLRYKILQLFAELEAPLKASVLANGKLTVKSLVEAYQHYFYQNPNFPLFVIAELNNNPAIMRDIFSNDEITHFKGGALQSISAVLKDIDAEIESEQLLVSLISMIVFPFMAKELLKLIFDKRETDYKAFMNRRNTLLWSMAEKIL